MWYCRGKWWARGTSMLHFLLCCNSVPSLLQNPIWSSLCLSFPLSASSTEAQFSLRTPHSVSSTPLILWYFSSHEGDFDSIFSKSSGTWSSPFLAPQHHWGQMGCIWCLPHLTFSVFAPPSEINFRPISFAFPLPYSGFNPSAYPLPTFSHYCVSIFGYLATTPFKMTLKGFLSVQTSLSVLNKIP